MANVHLKNNLNWLELYFGVIYMDCMAVARGLFTSNCFRIQFDAVKYIFIVIAIIDNKKLDLETQIILVRSTFTPLPYTAQFRVKRVHYLTLYICT